MTVKVLRLGWLWTPHLFQFEMVKTKVMSDIYWVLRLYWNVHFTNLVSVFSFFLGFQYILKFVGKFPLKFQYSSFFFYYWKADEAARESRQTKQDRYAEMRRRKDEEREAQERLLVSEWHCPWYDLFFNLFSYQFISGISLAVVHTGRGGQSSEG